MGAEVKSFIVKDVTFCKICKRNIENKLYIKHLVSNEHFHFLKLKQYSYKNNGLILFSY